MPASHPTHGSFPTTADMGIWAKAPTAAGLLEGLGMALYEALTVRRTIRTLETRSVEAHGPDDASMAVAFLNELIVLFQTEGFVAHSVRATVGPGPSMRAELSGELFDPDRHPRGVEVKAVTLHEAQFDVAAGSARIILDI